MTSLSIRKYRIELNKFNKFGENSRDIALFEIKRVRKHVENLQLVHLSISLYLTPQSVCNYVVSLG